MLAAGSEEARRGQAGAAAGLGEKAEEGQCRARESRRRGASARKVGLASDLLKVPKRPAGMGPRAREEHPSFIAHTLRKLCARACAWHLEYR